MEPECVLPPQVCGHSNGELIVKLEEIFWSVKSPGEIFVHLQWWGENNYHVFWPPDLNQKKEIGVCRPNSVVFSLRTTPKLFETYLKNCKDLTFYVVKETDRTIVGTCLIKDIADTLIVKSYTSFSSYYPIYNLQKSKIGDLRISFSLFLKKKSELDLSRAFDNSSSNVLFNQKHLSHKAEDICDVVAQEENFRRTVISSVLNESTFGSLINAVSQHGDSSVDNEFMNFIIGKKVSVPENVFPPESSSSNDSLVEMQSVRKMNKTGTFGEEIATSENTVCSDVSSKEEIKIKVEEDDTVRVVGLHPTEEVGESSSKTSQRPLENKFVGKWTNDQKYGNVENVDSLKLTVVSLHISAAGVRKIGIPNLKQGVKQKGNEQIKPNTLFTVEVSLPVRGVNKNISKPTVFISKCYYGNDVKFGNSLKQKLPAGPEFPWLKVSKICSRGEIKIYWRHLNQRLPTLLGVATIPEIMSDAQNNIDELNSTLNISTPVMSSTKLIVGKLSICIELGRNGTDFGKQLFNALVQFCGNKLKNRERVISNNNKNNNSNTNINNNNSNQVKLNGSKHKMNLKN